MLKRHPSFHWPPTRLASHLMDLCPNTETLRDFNEGRTSDFAEIDRIADHLGRCPKCLEKLDQMLLGALATGLSDCCSEDSQTIENWEGSDMDLGSSSGSFNDSFQEAMSILKSDSSTSSSTKWAQFGESRYQIMATIGEGQFGGVFVANLGRKGLFAIKIPDPRKLSSLKHRQQFLNDYKRSVLLRHPNILTPLEATQWDEKRMYCASQYLECPSLTTFAKNSRGIPMRILRSIITQIANAISFAHQHGQLHRHLNPDNIFIDNDYEGAESGSGKQEFTVRINDFGFLFDSRYQFGLLESQTDPSPFVSPESVNNDADYIDHRTDIFSIGKILKLLLRISQPPPETIATELNRIITRATAVRRRDRYQTVVELNQDLESLDIH